MKFRIEYIAKKERPVYVFARQLEPGEFRVSSTSSLGDVPIRPYISQPRALTSDGEPDRTVFTFILESANDVPKLELGQVVELSESFD